jgi:hypothetical protein
MDGQTFALPEIVRVGVLPHYWRERFYDAT